MGLLGYVGSGGVGHIPYPDFKAFLKGKNKISDKDKIGCETSLRQYLEF